MIANIIAVDPSSNSIGFAIFEVESRDLSIVSIKTYTFEPRLFTQHFDLARPLDYRISLVDKEVKKLIKKYSPILIAFETSYFNHRKPLAYEALLACTTVIRTRAVHNRIPYVGYTPLEVKATLNVRVKKKLKGKQHMLNAAVRDDRISKYINQTTTEHEIDALAVGLTAITDYKERGELLL